MSITPGHPRVPYTTSICTPGIGTEEAGYLHGVWASRSPVTTLVVAHTPIVGKVLDIPSPLSTSRIWVRVGVSVRRCYRFSGLCAFHLSGDVARSQLVHAYTPTAVDRCVGTMQGHSQQHACAASTQRPLGAPHLLEKHI